MAEWKAQINFNYNPSYHAYAYNLMYQPGTEQNHVNLSPWGEPGAADLCNNYSPTQIYYSPPAAAPRSPEEPQSPEQRAYNSGLGQYQSTGMVYYGDTEAGRLLMAGEPNENETRRTGSDSASDSEPQTSPDSWSSGSSGEGGLPQADPATWAHKTNLDDETSSTSPDSTENIPIVKEESQTFCIFDKESDNNMTNLENVSVIAPKTQSIKGKVRAAFSETQMNILTQRFNVQRYLTPAEMKNMAELTGLTYKQVKTWFQNRRMKLRRHQKDNSWASERYALKDSAGAAFTNLSSHIQNYQGQARPAAKEPYNPHVIEAALKNATPQNLALYLAAVGGANGCGSYPTWPSNTTQNTVHGRPQAPGWTLPSNTPQFAYSARFNAQSFSSASDAGFKEGEQVNRAPNNPITVQSSAQ